MEQTGNEGFQPSSRAGRPRSQGVGAGCLQPPRSCCSLPIEVEESNRLALLYRLTPVTSILSTPSNWPALLVLGVLRLVAALPHGWRMALGRIAGRIALTALRRRRAIALRNLQLCFPEWSDARRRSVLRAHFDSLGQGLVELAMGAWCSDAQVSELVEVGGAEHLEEAVRRGRGVIAISGHFTALEFTARALTYPPAGLVAVYRPGGNAAFAYLMNRARLRICSRTLSKYDVRGMVRALRDGAVLWYAGDQMTDAKSAVLAPFFGEPAMTGTALGRLARISSAPVVPWFTRRLANGRYRVELLPALESFPGESPEEEAGRINALIEQQVRKAPEQYYWIHRRFKRRPPPLTDPYG